jgi:hypothetical protein
VWLGNSQGPAVRWKSFIAVISTSLSSSRPIFISISSKHSSPRSVGHKGKFGHEFMEFEITPNGKLRYANNSNYKNDVMIRKEGKQSLFLLSSPPMTEAVPL